MGLKLNMDEKAKKMYKFWKKKIYSKNEHLTYFEDPKKFSQLTEFLSIFNIKSFVNILDWIKENQISFFDIFNLQLHDVSYKISANFGYVVPYRNTGSFQKKNKNVHFTDCKCEISPMASIYICSNILGDNELVINMMKKSDMYPNNDNCYVNIYMYDKDGNTIFENENILFKNEDNSKRINKLTKLNEEKLNLDIKVLLTMCVITTIKMYSRESFRLSSI